MTSTAKRLRTFWGERQFDRVAISALAVSYWEVALYGALVSLALGLRLWHLDARAIHHDESLHMYYAWQLFEGRGYEHVPFMHGPLKFFAGALTFRLFGDTDFTARLPFALVGSALVGLPYLLRAYLGRAGAVVAALLLAISPTLLYVSRFNRDDILIAAYTLAMVIVIWRYLKEQREAYLYAVPLLLMLGFTTMEVTFITTAIFLVFLEYQLANDLLDQLRASRTMTWPEEALAFVVLLVAGWAIAIAWPLIEGPRKRWSLTVMPPAAHLIVLIIAFALPQFAAAVQKVPFPWFDGIHHLGTPNTYDVGRAHEKLKIITTVTFLVISMYIGLLWNWRIWVIGALIFYIPFVLLYTTFFTNPGGFWTGSWGSLDYWLSQQLVRRGNQPDYYYFMFLPVYEFVPLVFALGGALFYAFRGKMEQKLLTTASLALVLLFSLLPGTAPLIGQYWKAAFVIAIGTVLLLKMDGFTKFLLFWTLSMLFALTWAGEKMPWLIIHIALPMAILAAKVIDDLLSSIGRAAEPAASQKPARATRAKAAAIRSPMLDRLLPLVAGGALAVIAAIIFQAAGPSSGLSIIAWLLALVVAAIAVGTGVNISPQMAGQVAGVALFGALCVFTVRAAGMAAFDQGDAGSYPQEMLIYAQGSPALNTLRDDIVQFAHDSGQGNNLPIVLDNSVNIWPWPWILRHYEGKGLTYSNFDTAFTPPDGAVVLISNGNQSKMQPFLDKYRKGIPYTHMWWFPENYQGLKRKQFLTDLFNGHTISVWRTYFIDRTVAGASAAPDLIAYFPKTAQVIVPNNTTPTSGPATDLPATSVTVIGGSGATAGQFAQPSDIAIDAQGNVYVADTLNHRFQKIVPSGQATPAGAVGTGPGQFGDPRLQDPKNPEDGPWGIGVDAQGNIYVADTWNSRIEKFGPDLRFIKEFSASGLFGPRDVAVDARGNVYIVDTGNKHVHEYSADGTLVKDVGTTRKDSKGYFLASSSHGEFDEPTSISIAPNGDIYVADFWNKRIQHFDSSFQYKGEIQVGSWGSKNINERAYIAVLADGHLLATDPTGGRILVFDATGKQQGAWRLPAPTGTTRPIGITVDEAHGAAYVSDGITSEVVRVSLSALLAPAPTP